ncbi:hypothetical protein DM02DRAFT_664699 [Periconia macrospinosa]|uniref:Uncharacterized protein n=1 Tax=Periconia macrospinosa TaxID=97972 RepID=A0A2V1CYE5_9PLEO|nr:hypothetical protein DM02DRAFT_664699 [Periconia macrospinosa]
MKRKHRQIAEHCAAQHQWVNPVSRGYRPTNTDIHERPWEVDVPCQHFRLTGIGADLFRVEVEEQQAQSIRQTQPNVVRGKTWAQLEAELDTLHTASSTRQTIATPDTSARYPIHMSAWLEKTGWPVYLEGQNLRAVARLLDPPTTAEPGLKALDYSPLIPKTPK